MKTETSDVRVFVLTKNEEQNIGRCLESLRASQWDVVVLDSGSVDNTQLIVSEFKFAEFRAYGYTNHCAAYNEITSSLSNDRRHVVILDADMVVSAALLCEMKALMASEPRPEVLESEIMMCVEGLPMEYGSLCPPKACVFATGSGYFVSSGHGERLRPGLIVGRTKAKLLHDDRKSYASYLESQLRYARNLVSRKAAGQASFRDWLRTKTPLLIFAVPFFSFVLKTGFRSGRAGTLYAIDRLIAEAIMYRQSLSNKSADL